MEAKIIGKTNNSLLIEWECEDEGMGQISLTYIGSGAYKLDAEYIGIDAVINIFKALEPKEQLTP